MRKARLRAKPNLNQTVSRHVFVIEDDEEVRSSTRLFLEALGYDVRTFASAEALLAAEDCGAADCLVLDYQLPGISGLELLDVLRGRGVTSPAIIVSGKGFGLQSRAAQLGIVAVLRKPLSADALSQWLEQIFREG